MDPMLNAKETKDDVEITGVVIKAAGLILAAPDMYKALKGVLRVADRQTVEFDAARSAIAKAEGRNEDKPVIP